MAPVRHRDQLDTGIRWINRLVDTLERGPIERDVLHSNLSSIRDALMAARGDLRRREEAVITAESTAQDQRAGDIVDVLVASRAVAQIADQVEGLARLAQAAADRAQFRQIDRAAVVIVDNLELLLRGIVRPKPQSDQKGA